MSLARRALMIGLALVTGACTTYGVVENKPLLPGEGNPGYTLAEFARNLNHRSDELTLALAFSGGGTRAAALSYGVMLELRDTRVRDERHGTEPARCDQRHQLGLRRQLHVGLLRPVRRSPLRGLRGTLPAPRRGRRLAARPAESAAVVQQPRPHRDGGGLLPGDALRRSHFCGPDEEGLAADPHQHLRPGLRRALLLRPGLLQPAVLGPDVVFARTRGHCLERRTDSVRPGGGRELRRLREAPAAVARRRAEARQRQPQPRHDRAGRRLVREQGGAQVRAVRRRGNHRQPGPARDAGHDRTSGRCEGVPAKRGHRRRRAASPSFR